MKQKMTFKSATLNGDFANYSFEQEIAPNTINTVNIKSGMLIHDDLNAAFKKLHPHLAAICEEIQLDENTDIEQLTDYDPDKYSDATLNYKVSLFRVSAFKLSSTGENEGVVLLGEKRLSTGEYVGLQTPKIKWEETQYAYVNELRLAIQGATEEVEAYHNGKSAPKMVQTEIFASHDDDFELAL